jgi:hypothetical protein
VLIVPLIVGWVVMGSIRQMPAGVYWTLLPIGAVCSCSSSSAW